MNAALSFLAGSVLYQFSPIACGIALVLLALTDRSVNNLSLN